MRERGRILTICLGFPALLILLGIVAHVTYFTLLKTYPFVAITDAKFISSCGKREREIEIEIDRCCVWS